MGSLADNDTFLFSPVHTSIVVWRDTFYSNTEACVQSLRETLFIYQQ